MGSQGPSQLWLRSGQCQLLLGLFWDRDAGQAAAALPGACCSPWGLSRGVPTVVRRVGVHQGLSAHHRAGMV